MRSVYAHLKQATRSDVEADLTRTYARFRETGWTSGVGDSAVLWISIWEDPEAEFEPSTWHSVVEQMGGTPIATVAADVSGRVPGDKEVLSFVRTILSQFDGLVQDDYSANVWSLADIERNVLKDGHPFFDYRGWHESDLDGWTVLS